MPVDVRGTVHTATASGTRRGCRCPSDTLKLSAVVVQRASSSKSCELGLQLLLGLHAVRLEMPIKLGDAWTTGAVRPTQAAAAPSARSAG